MVAETDPEGCTLDDSCTDRECDEGDGCSGSVLTGIWPPLTTNFVAASSTMTAGPYKMLAQLSPALAAVGYSTSADGAFALRSGSSVLLISEITDPPICSNAFCEGTVALIDCSTLGFVGAGSTSCNPDCTLNVASCINASNTCGDGQTSPSAGEDCDNSESPAPADTKCTSLGFDKDDANALVCQDSCLWNLNGCEFFQNRDVSAGTTHACASTVEGGSNVGVTCWGDNSLNQSKPFDPIPALRDVQVGDGFSCGIRLGSDALYCWGDTFASLVPEPNPSCLPNNCTQRFSKLHVARNGFCVQQFSDGTWLCAYRPDVLPLDPTPYTNSIAFDLGDALICGASASNLQCTSRITSSSGSAFIDVTNWSANVTNELVTGLNSVCALKEGNVSCWSVTSGGTFLNLNPLGLPAELNNIVDIDIRGDKICAYGLNLTTASKIVCWNADENVTTANPLVDPTSFDLAPSVPVNGLSLGDGYVCLDTNSGARCAEIQFPTPTPPAEPPGIGEENRFGQQIAPYATVIALATAPILDRTCALKIFNDANDTSLVCWGADAPTIRSFETNWISVALSDDDICLLRDGGGVKCQSQNLSQSLIQDWIAPQYANGQDYNFYQVDVDNGVACGVVRAADASDGSVYCWDLSGGPPVNFDPLPTEGAPFTKIVVHEGGWCTISADGFVPGVGTLRCSPKITETFSSIPSETSLPTYKDISLARNYGCGVRGGGFIDCWHGNDPEGFPTDPANDPTRPAVSVHVSPSHACALLSDGSLDCWGLLPWEIGNMPPRAKILQNVQVGGAGVCAIRRDQGLVCWGYNKVLGHH